MKLYGLRPIILNILNEFFIYCIDNGAIGSSCELLLPIHHISDLHKFLLVPFVTPKDRGKKLKS